MSILIMALSRCPICERAFDPAASTAMPFCSDRCRLADLGRWLDEGYHMPVERAEEDDAGEARYGEPDEE
jgi:endogenous inhibitor of DNA gyrase (YacG/DUF329 family)